MEPPLKPKEIIQFVEAFSFFDRDENGTIPTVAIENVLLKLGASPCEDELQGAPFKTLSFENHLKNILFI